MRPLLWTALVLSLVFEPTLGPRLSPVGGRPLLLLSVVVYYSWMKGATAGTLFGLALGFLADLLGLGPPGPSMLGFALVGAAVGNTWGSVYKDSTWVQVLVLGFAAWLHETVIFVIVTRLDLPAYPIHLARNILPTMVLTAAAFPLLIAGWERLFHREISLDAQRVVVRTRR